LELGQVLKQVEQAEVGLVQEQVLVEQTEVGLQVAFEQVQVPLELGQVLDQVEME
jgi:hypothetical protein